MSQSGSLSFEEYFKHAGDVSLCRSRSLTRQREKNVDAVIDPTELFVYPKRDTTTDSQLYNDDDDDEEEEEEEEEESIFSPSKRNKDTCPLKSQPKKKSVTSYSKRETKEEEEEEEEEEGGSDSSSSSGSSSDEDTIYSSSESDSGSGSDSDSSIVSSSKRSSTGFYEPPIIRSHLKISQSYDFSIKALQTKSVPRFKQFTITKWIELINTEKTISSYVKMSCKQERHKALTRIAEDILNLFQGNKQLRSLTESRNKLFGFAIGNHATQALILLVQYSMTMNDLYDQKKWTTEQQIQYTSSLLILHYFIRLTHTHKASMEDKKQRETSSSPSAYTDETSVRLNPDSKVKNLNRYRRAKNVYYTAYQHEIQGKEATVTEAEYLDGAEMVPSYVACIQSFCFFVTDILALELYKGTTQVPLTTNASVVGDMLSLPSMYKTVPGNNRHKYTKENDLCFHLSWKCMSTLNQFSRFIKYHSNALREQQQENEEEEALPIRGRNTRELYAFPQKKHVSFYQDANGDQLKEDRVAMFESHLAAFQNNPTTYGFTVEYEKPAESDRDPTVIYLQDFVPENATKLTTILQQDKKQCSIVFKVMSLYLCRVLSQARILMKSRKHDDLDASDINMVVAMDKRLFQF